MLAKVRTITAALVVAACGAAPAWGAPVTYSYSTGPAFGSGSTTGAPGPDTGLFAAGVSGTLVYDSEAPLQATLADGASLYRGFFPASDPALPTSLSNLSGTAGGLAFSDLAGATLVGNDTHLPALNQQRVDVFQFLFEPALSSPARNLSGFEIDGFTLVAVRMFWIEGQQTPGLIPDFITSQELFAAPPSFTGRLAFDFVETANPAPNPNFFMLFDNLQLTPAVAAIPEPGTYALMLAGLGLLGFSCARRMGR